MTSYAAVLHNTPKIFARAFGARHTYPIFKSKTSQKCKKIRLRLQRAEKWSIFGTARRKRVNFSKCWWVCPPLENFLRAPMYGSGFSGCFDQISNNAYSTFRSLFAACSGRTALHYHGHYLRLPCRRLHQVGYLLHYLM